MAKPSGTLGPLVVTITSDGRVGGSFEQVSFSPAKADVEKYMTERFIASMNHHLASSGETFILSNPEANRENDFDFTVTSSNGLAYLELIEVAPLRGPYGEAPASYRPYALAEAILSGILRKSERYPKNLERDLFLLLYVTHWTFSLSEITVACVRYWLKKKRTVFRAIFSYQPLDDFEGTPQWLFPVPPELLGSFDPEQIRDNVCLNLDPQKFEMIGGNKP